MTSLQKVEIFKPAVARKRKALYFNGYIVKNGELTGVAVPVNKAITEMIPETEIKGRKISPDNFYEPIFGRF
jgi:hypothetical protein